VQASVPDVRLFPELRGFLLARGTPGGVFRRFVDGVGVRGWEFLSSTQLMLQALGLGVGSHFLVNGTRPGWVPGLFFDR